MQTSNLMKIIVSAVIGVVVFAAILIPVIGEATTTERTFTNEGYFSMDKILSTDSETETISWASTAPATLVVNGVNLNVADFGLSNSGMVTIFASETDIIRIGANVSGTSLSWMQVRGSTWAYTSATSSFSATIAAGTMTCTLDGTERVATYEQAYIIDETGSGAYVMKKANESAYMAADSEFYNIGITNITEGFLIFKVSGNVEAGTVETIAYSPDTLGTPTISEETVVSEAVDDYIDLYRFDKLTFTATYTGGEVDCTYSYVIVPAEVTAELSVHPGTSEIALINIIPMLVLVGLVLGVVGAVIARRD